MLATDSLAGMRRQWKRSISSTQRGNTYKPNHGLITKTPTMDVLQSALFQISKAIKSRPQYDLTYNHLLPFRQFMEVEVGSEGSTLDRPPAFTAAHPFITLFFQSNTPSYASFSSPNY